MNDVARFTEEELTAPILTREEFERQQAVELYHEKATRAGEEMCPEIMERYNAIKAAKEEIDVKITPSIKNS